MILKGCRPSNSRNSVTKKNVKKKKLYGFELPQGNCQPILRQHLATSTVQQIDNRDMFVVKLRGGWVFRLCLFLSLITKKK